MLNHKPHWPTPEQMGFIEKACRRLSSERVDRMASEVLGVTHPDETTFDEKALLEAHALLDSELRKPMLDAWSFHRELLRSHVGLGGFKTVLLNRMGKQYRVVKTKSKVGRRSLRVCTDPGDYPLKKGQVLFARETNTFHIRRDDAHLLPADIRGLL